MSKITLNPNGSAQSPSLSPSNLKEDLEATCVYLTHNLAANRLNYADQVAKNLPMGSEVTEAAGKTLVKQSLCGSGMRWKTRGSNIVLSLRALVQTSGRWLKFWEKVNEFGSIQYA